MKNDLLRQILNIVGMLVVLVVNAMASLLPLNGLTTAQISDSFFILFVPAGYVFSIWGIIYLGLIAFTVYQALPAQRSNARMQKMGIWFFLSGIANSFWLVSFHYQLFGLAMIMMLVLLGILIRIYTLLGIGKEKVKPVEKWVVNLPFSIYLGWITVATIANASQLLYFVNWDGFGIAAEIWTLIMLAAALIISTLVSFTRKDVGYALVLVWALVGIAIKQSAVPIVANAAWISAVVIAGVLVIALIQKRVTAR